MRSDLAVLLLGSAISVSADGINFSAIYKARPDLKSLKPTASTPVNRYASASSVISRMNDVKPAIATASKPSTTPATSVKGSPKTTKRVTLKPITKKTTTRKTTAKKAAKKVAKKKTKQKRDAVCGAQSILYGYSPKPNDAQGFLVDNLLATTAGLINPPAGYTKNFLNAFGSVNADGYIGYYQLANYSVQACADICTSVGDACQAFNIYYERNPTVNPDAVSCPNPTAATSVRCALWGSKITLAQAINIGQWRANFMTVVSGSNGYWKNPTPAAVTGFNQSQALAGFVNPSNKVSLSTTFVAGSGHDPAACGALCTKWNSDASTSASNNGITTYQPCNFFNAAILSANGVAVPGTYCALFSGTDAAKYGSLFQSTAPGTSVTYDISSSYGYVLTTPDNGTVTAKPGTCAALGSPFAPKGGRSYSLRCQTDYQANDIGGQWQANLTACLSLCDSTTNCNGAVWVQNAYMCYMKDLTNPTTSPVSVNQVDFAFLAAGPYTYGATTAAAASTKTTSTATAAQGGSTAQATGTACANYNSTQYSVPGTTRKWEFHCNYDLAANDLGGFQAPNITACVSTCNSMANCSGAVWVNQGNFGYCYTKNLSGVTSKATVSNGADLLIDPAVWKFAT